MPGAAELKPDGAAGTLFPNPLADGAEYPPGTAIQGAERSFAGGGTFTLSASGGPATGRVNGMAVSAARLSGGADSGLTSVTFIPSGGWIPGTVSSCGGSGVVASPGANGISVPGSTSGAKSSNGDKGICGASAASSMSPPSWLTGGETGAAAPMGIPHAAPTSQERFKPADNSFMDLRGFIA